jgi:hypothetical protein
MSARLLGLPAVAFPPCAQRALRARSISFLECGSLLPLFVITLTSRSIELEGGPSFLRRLQKGWVLTI